MWETLGNLLQVVQSILAFLGPVRDFAAQNPEVWTAGWMLLTAIGTLFIPPKLLPMWNLAISNAKRLLEKRPGFSKEKAEQDQEIVQQDDVYKN